MSIESKLLDAARRILYPLVRILLRNGIPSDALTELVRKTYVDVAEKEFAIEGKRQTTARISVITGLNRKEVARLRNLADLSEDDKRRWNRAASVLGSWLRDTEFQDRKGDPIDLPFEPLEDGAPSFVALVKKYSGDMQPWAIADELIRVGAVEMIDGKLRMTTRGYVPAEDPESVAEILGIDTAEFIETVDHTGKGGDSTHQGEKLNLGHLNIDAHHAGDVGVVTDEHDRLAEFVPVQNKPQENGEG